MPAPCSRDFFVTMTAMFRTVYVCVVLDVGSRRIIHWNVTEHPTAAWTIQQFRATAPGDQPQRFLIHDRDSIYAAAVDDAVTAMGLTVLKTPALSNVDFCTLHGLCGHAVRGHGYNRSLNAPW